MGDPAKGEAHRISKRKRERMADLRGADSSSTEKKSAEENMKLFGATRGEAESQDRCKTKKQKLDPMVFGLKGGVTFESSDECSTSGDLETSDGFLKLPSDGNYLITQKVLDQCPACYAALQLENCTFNIKYLFYKVICECGVQIFYVPKTPANIEHPLTIVETE